MKISAELDSRNEKLCQLARDNPCLMRSVLAERFGISRERVRQILKKAGERTRHYTQPKDRRRVCICGNDFEQHGPSRYCPDCRNVPLVCDNCGKAFTRHITLIKQQYNPKNPLVKATAFYCSRHCKMVAYGKKYGFGAHPENVRLGYGHRKRNQERWALVWQKHLETGWGAMRLSRELRVPQSSISMILATKRKEGLPKCVEEEA